MTHCCGKDRAARFCPDCGKPFESVGLLHDLLAHLRKTEKMRRSTVKHDERKIGERPEHGRRYKKYSASHDRSAEKFKAWGDALEVLLNKEND